MRDIPGPPLQPCPPAGPATQRQDTGRNVHLQDFCGKLPRSLLPLCSFVLQLLPDELEQPSDPFLCQGLWSTGIIKCTGFTPKLCPIWRKKNPFFTPWNCVVQHSQLWLTRKSHSEQSSFPVALTIHEIPEQWSRSRSCRGFGSFQ